MVRGLQLLSWNADGLQGKKRELEAFLVEHDVDVALLQETHLGPADTFNVANYATYRADSQRQPGALRRQGGAAVLVRRSVPHRELPRPSPTLDAASVALELGGRELHVTSVYVRPATRLDPAVLDTTLRQDEPSILAGDLNSKHVDWGSRTTNTSGRHLHRLLAQRQYVAVTAPLEPTHYPRAQAYRPDVLDIALHTALPAPLEATAVSDLSSDHLPVLLTLGDPMDQRLPPGRPPQVDWNRYRTFLEQRPQPLPLPPQDRASLDAQVERLQATLQEAVRAASKPTRPRTAPRAQLPQHIVEEVKKRRRLRAHWQRTRCPAAKADFNRQSRLVTKLLQDYSDHKWASFLEDKSLEDGSLWRLAKTLRTEKRTIRPLHGARGVVYDVREKAETFADSLEEQFSPHPDVYDEEHCDHVEDFVDDIGYGEEEDDDPPAPVTEAEVRGALARLRPKKAPGLDDLGTPALQNLPPWVVEQLTAIYNHSFRLRHFPAPWKIAKVILIPKPGKDPLFPENHRPISLLPVLGKVLERLILSRFPEDFHNSIRPEQFGFRRGHSTTLQLANVINSAAAAINQKRASTCVLLDVSKAFDRVWHPGLLYKLAHSPLPPTLFGLLRSYLEGRYFVVAIGAVVSTRRPVMAGVPQGSVLGPVLYDWYTNDMPVERNVQLALYADDAMFRATSANTRMSTVYMQRQMTALQPWLRKWRIKVNSSKSTAICFTRRAYADVLRQRIRLNGEVVPWKASVKYLGVTLDRKLTLTPHATSRARLAAAAAGSLSPLLGKSSALSLHVKLLLYKSIIRPALTYAAPAWYHLTCRTSRVQLQRAQNKILRAATRSPWYVRNSVIHASSDVPTIEQFVASCTDRFRDAAAASEWDHIRDIVAQPPPQLRGPRRRPAPDA